MRILAVCLTGCILDFVLGDPYWLYHPVRLIGALIAKCEQICRRIANGSKWRLLIGGGVIFVVVLLVSTAVPAGLLYLASKIHPLLSFGLESFWCYQILAARSLQTESMKVCRELKKQDLPAARKAVSMIVGRDTDSLDAEGVTKAAVETVAENTSDGVIAQLLFLLIGGAPLGFAYKAVNTMDSMLGYKEETYLYIGRTAAKADDVVNYIPARISALLMIAGAFLCGMDGKQAWKIFRRDRRKHASPNSAQTESVCAGALGIQLAGDACYFGKRYKKETIGDPLRSVEAEDIKRAALLMYATEILTLFLFGSLRFLLCLI